MPAIAVALPKVQQRQLQEELNQSRLRFEIAFSLAQEMATRGPEPVLTDPGHQRRYGDELLNMANCLVQMAEMRLEQATAPPEVDLPYHISPFTSPLQSARAPGGGTELEEYHRTRKL